MEKKTKFCGNCGFNVPDEYKFCRNCGLKFDLNDQNTNTEIPKQNDNNSSGIVISSNFLKMVGILVLAITVVYFLNLGQKAKIAGTYIAGTSIGDSSAVLLINDDYSAKFDIIDDYQTPQETYSINFVLKPYGDKKYIIDDASGFYLDVIIRGTPDELATFVYYEFEEYEEYLLSRPGFTYENYGDHLKFSSGKLTVSEMIELDVYLTPLLILEEFGENLRVLDEILYKQ